MNDAPEATPTATTSNFYRTHTFEKRGPNARERKAYLHSIAIVLPHPKGSPPLEADYIARYFVEQRAARFPEQAKQERERAAAQATARARARHAREQEGRAKR